MKKLITLLAILSIILTASCQKLEKDTYLSIDKYMIEFKSEGEIRTLDLKTNGTPSVVTPSWVSHQIENSGDEQWTLVLKCTENTTSDVRNGILRVDSGNARKSVSLRQNQRTQTTPDNNTSDTENNTDGTEDVTPQVISDLLALNGKSCLYSIAKTNETIRMTYLENWTSGRVPAADDFKVIEVSNDLLRGFADEKNSVIFHLNTGGSSKINVVDFPMEVTLRQNSISSELFDLVNGSKTKDTINFSVICPRPEFIKIEPNPECIDGFSWYNCWSTSSNIINGIFDGQIIITATWSTEKITNYHWTFSLTHSFPSLNKTVNIPYKIINNQPGITKEEIRNGLVALYNACNGKNWTNKKNWLSNKDITEWEGVQICEHGADVDNITINGYEIPIRVFDIDLEYNNLSGIIPQEFWDICNKGCAYINLSRNNLSGNVIPSNFWGEFMNYVNLNQTNIEVTLDDAIKSAAKLAKLKLSDTKCTAPTEKFFDTKFPLLKKLYVDFATPSPLPNNMVNFKYNAPNLFMGSFKNVTSYPNNLNSYWTHVYLFYINGKRVVENKDVVGPGDSIFG
jgi:hypothetical protein